MLKKQLLMRTKCGAGLAGFLLVCGLCVLSACADDGALAAGGTDEGAPCLVTLRPDVGGFAAGGAQQTRIVAGADNEYLVNDIWVFQFDAATGESLHEPVYIDKGGNLNTEDIVVNLATNDDGGRSRVCIVANTGDDKWVYDGDELSTVAAGFSTYDSFLAQAIPAAAAEPFLSGDLGSSAEDADNIRTIPMFGVSKDMTIASECYVSVPLYRMFAKVDVTVDGSYLPEGMKPVSLSFSNIPAYCRVGALSPADDAQPAAFPEDIGWTVATADAPLSATLYVPENPQGKVAGMESKLDAAEGDIPVRALAVSLEVSYGDGRTHTYTVYPGLDTKNDFNVRRNHIYDVNLKIENLPESQN